MANEREKEAAARASLRFIRSGQIVGIGTGSTTAYFIQALAEEVKRGLEIRGIPTSIDSRDKAAGLGIPLTTLDESPVIDVNVDGADEVDGELRLIKGGGGALLREKIVAAASKKFVVIADGSKKVSVLGKFGLPVEVIKFAQAVVKGKIEKLGAKVSLRTKADGKPFLTDEDNYIFDCHFGEIHRPEQLACTLSEMPGVVEHGLFLGMASVVLIGNGDEIVELRRG